MQNTLIVIFDGHVQMNYASHTELSRNENNVDNFVRV